MKKRLFSMLLCLFMALALLPAPVLADPAASVSVGGVTLDGTEGKTWWKNGDTAATGATGTAEDWNAKFEVTSGAATLTLNNAAVPGAALYENSYGIYTEGDLTLVLCGVSAATAGAAAQESLGILVGGNLTIRGDGALTAVGGTASSSYGIFGRLINISGGTVTAVGGAAGISSCGMYGYDGAGVSGGRLIAVGGAATAYSWGVNSGEDEGITYTGGLLVARGRTAAMGWSLINSAQGGTYSAVSNGGAAADVSGYYVVGPVADGRAVYSVHAGNVDSGTASAAGLGWSGSDLTLTNSIIIGEGSESGDVSALSLPENSTLTCEGFNAVLAGDTDGASAAVNALKSLDINGSGSLTAIGGSGSASCGVRAETSLAACAPITALAVGIETGGCGLECGTRLRLEACGVAVGSSKAVNKAPTYGKLVGGAWDGRAALWGCQVSFSLTGLTAAGAPVAEWKKDYTATLTVKSGFRGPVTIDGVENPERYLTEGEGYTYDAVTGLLTVKAEYVTGGLIVTASAVSNSSVIVGGVTLDGAEGRTWWKNGDTAATGATGTAEDWNAKCDPSTVPVTLTLRDADIYNAGGDGIYISSSGLILVLEGDSRAVGSDTLDVGGEGIYVRGDLTITGSGSLTAVGGRTSVSGGGCAGIEVSGTDNTLTISGCTVTAVGDSAPGHSMMSYGVYSFSDVEIKDGAVFTAVGGATGRSSYGIYTHGDVRLSGADTKVVAVGGAAGSSYGVYSNKSPGGRITCDGGLLVATGGVAALNITPDISAAQQAFRGASDSTYYVASPVTGGEPDYYVLAGSVGRGTAAVDGHLTWSGSALTLKNTVVISPAAAALTLPADGRLTAQGFCVLLGGGAQSSAVTAEDGSATVDGGEGLVAVGVSGAAGRGIYAPRALTLTGSITAIGAANGAGGATVSVTGPSRGVAVGGESAFSAAPAGVAHWDSAAALWDTPAAPAPATRYGITVQACDGGSVLSSHVRAAAGSTVTLTPAAAESCALEELSAVWRGGEIYLTETDGAYTFRMPSGPVTVTAVFAWLCPFTDVEEGDWFYPHVEYVCKNGLFDGVEHESFEPMTPMSRAMLVQVLWRMEGEPEAKGGAAFSDVAAGDWFETAVLWAAGEGLVEGWDGKFAPLDAVTREQLAAVLCRWAAWKGLDVSAGQETDILSYSDGAEVSGWAVPAVRWACGAGLLEGVGAGRLAPRDFAARCQVAAVLHRLLES